MENLEYLLEKFGFVKQTRVDNDFRRIENFIGFQLPDDYKYYLNNYKPFEDFVGEQYIALYTVADLVALNNLNALLSNTIAIGSDGASETIGISFLETSNYKIVMAQYIQNVDDYIEIGTSFTDMLKRLDEGLKWFN